MFTRMAKGILKFVTIALVIVSLLAGFGLADGEASAGVFCSLIFLAVSFVIVCGFGIYVELANNILDIKELLEEREEERGRPNVENSHASNSKMSLLGENSRW